MCLRPLCFHRPAGQALQAVLCALLAAAPPAPAQAQGPEPATPASGWERLGRAARNAATAPRTWAPLLGALALQFGDSDRRLQVWAAEHTPLFGSRASADRASDDLKFAANGLWIASALAPWQDEAEGTWLASKARVLAVEGGAHMVNGAIVGELKDRTARMRPNDAGATSFPSDHAARAGLHTSMTRYNLANLGWSDDTQRTASVGLDALTGLTAWARVEANQHYPSDVLAGMALGNFIGVLFTEAWLEPAAARALQVQVQPGPQPQLRLQWRF